MKSEAKTIARLEHPGIVPIHDIGELPDGRVFYAMKLVRGETLRAFVAHERSRAGLMRLFLRICDAVAFAHAAGIVHRDIKPDNVMVGGFGEVLVMDWGVATTIDATGEIAGTSGFMAPEQMRGEPADRRADIFALGALLRELVTLEDPKLPRPLRAIVDKAKAPSADDRYQDVTQLAADVASYIDGLPLIAYRENVFERMGRWARRNIALVSIVIAYLVMRVIVYLIVNR
jgi:serine/threonine protein kinase